MTAVLGTVLMLALMMTLVPGAILMRAAVSEEMQAQREAAELAAYCARNPDVGPPICELRTPLPGYECHETEVGVWLCTRPVAATIATPTVTSPVVSPVIPTLGL